MAKSSKGKVVNLIDPLFTVGSLPPADRHEELFYEAEKQAMEMQSRKMLEEIERCKIEGRRKSFRRDPKTPRQFQVKRRTSTKGSNGECLH